MNRACLERALGEAGGYPSEMREGAGKPDLLIDGAKMQQNIEKMADIARRNGVALRPHVKTHKIPSIARAQVEADGRRRAVR